MAQPTLTPREFAQKWSDNETKERAASQEHFIDLCRMLGEPTPNEADPTGQTYAFEKAVTKASGGDGFADVWKKDHFGWVYKDKGKDLKAAYLQLLRYREGLSNPPMLVVSDLETIEIRTNFPNLSHKLYVVTLADLAVGNPTEALILLRRVLTAPNEFRPRSTSSAREWSVATTGTTQVPQSTSSGHRENALRPPGPTRTGAQDGADTAFTGGSTLDPKGPVSAGGRKSVAATDADRARDAELDRLWEAKKVRTRRERARIDGAISKGRDLARARSLSRPISPVPSVGHRGGVDPSVMPGSPPLRLKPTSRGPASRPEPIAGGADGPMCPHGMSRSNCAHCRPGRFLPPIKLRK